MASCCVLSMIFVSRSWICCNYCCYCYWTVGLFDGAIVGLVIGTRGMFGLSMLVLLYYWGMWTCCWWCYGVYTGTYGGRICCCCT